MKFGLIGCPLGHSFSGKYFSEKFELERLPHHYELMPIENIELVEDLISDRTLIGFNVTIPYKQGIVRFLDEVSEDALAIGAVNVVKIYRDVQGNKVKAKGFNSDWIGFTESLRPLLHPGVENALILGTGGASKAVSYALSRFGIKSTFVSRHKSEKTIDYESLTPEIMERNLLIVNTTPLGMWPNVENAPAIPYSLLTEKHICYDLVYNPDDTEFMKRSRRYGATVKNGLEMLHRQADEAWRIWSSPE